MMKIVFSESNPDYKNYTFPYVVWGIPEGISEIAELYSMGFLPSKKPYYYLARSTRISLNRFKVTQRLRKLLNARKDIEMQLVDARNFVLDALAKSMCLQCAASRFGKGVVDECRLDRIIAPINTTHIMQFRWRGKMIGLVAMNIVDAVAHYNFAFYDLTLAKMSPGIYMLATAAVFLKSMVILTCTWGLVTVRLFCISHVLRGLSFLMVLVGRKIWKNSIFSSPVLRHPVICLNVTSIWRIFHRWA